MTLRIRTQLGEQAARKIALLLAKKEVYISCIFFVHTMPGYEDYHFTTDGSHLGQGTGEHLEFET